MSDIKNIYDELVGYGYTPIKFFRGSEVINLTKQKNLNGIKIDKKRPFVVFEIKKEDKKYIYKREIKDPGNIQSIQKEVFIHEFILPKIYSRLPQKMKEKVFFPKMVQTIEENGMIKAFIREEVKGVICGINATTKKNILNKEDIKIIACVIKNFQSVDPNEFEKRTRMALPERDFLEGYGKNLGDYKKAVRPLMGAEYAAKMDKLLRIAEEIIPKEQLTVLSEDVTSMNVIKTPDKKLGFIDWERPYTGRNPAADYSRFIVRLWTVPGLMQEAVKTVIEINKENSNFITLLKISLVFTDGSHMLLHYYKKMKNGDVKEKKEAIRGIRILKKLLIDVLDNKGVWKQ